MNQTTVKLTPLEQFRSEPETVAHMRRLLEDQVMQRALLILQDGNPPVDVPLTAPEVASVRALSQSNGFRSALMHLLSMAEPYNPPQPEPDPTWGTDNQAEGAD